MNLAATAKRVQVELEKLGKVAAEYRITEINGDAVDLHFDHQTKTVRVGEPAHAPSIDFFGGATISFLEPEMPNFF